MSKVKFKTTKEEYSIVSKVVKRAKKELIITDGISLSMDLTATHSNGTLLDFDKLLAFDEENFGHDIYGIIRHIDRSTGKLTRGFLPRCAK